MTRLSVLLLIVLVGGLSVSATTNAARLQLGFGAIRTLLMEQVFTTHGRRYLSGGPDSRCSYAFLDQPQVTADGKRLQLAARFNHRTAVNVRGSCVGPSEAFDVSISGIPNYMDGVIYLGEVHVEPSQGLYAGLIRAVLGDALLGALRYPLLQEAQKLADRVSAQSDYDIRITSLKVDDIRVEPGAIVFSFDFSVQVK